MMNSSIEDKWYCCEGFPPPVAGCYRVRSKKSKNGIGIIFTHTKNKKWTNISNSQIELFFGKEMEWRFDPELLYAKLTRDQINYVFNGVGSETIPVRPPSLIFKEPARKHDVLYYIGCSEEDRIRADKIFLQECYKRVEEKQHRIFRPLYNGIAWLYGKTVYKIGYISFEYGDYAYTWEQIKLRVDNDKKVLQQRKDNKKWYQFWI